MRPLFLLLLPLLLLTDGPVYGRSRRFLSRLHVHATWHWCKRFKVSAQSINKTVWRFFEISAITPTSFTSAIRYYGNNSRKATIWRILFSVIKKPHPYFRQAWNRKKRGNFMFGQRRWLRPWLFFIWTHFVIVTRCNRPYPTSYPYACCLNLNTFK